MSPNNYTVVNGHHIPLGDHDGTPADRQRAAAAARVSAAARAARRGPPPPPRPLPPVPGRIPRNANGFLNNAGSRDSITPAPEAFGPSRILNGGGLVGGSLLEMGSKNEEVSKIAGTKRSASELVGDYGLGAGVEDVNASRCNEEGVINIEKVPVMVSLDKCDAAQKLKQLELDELSKKYKEKRIDEMQEYVGLFQAIVVDDSFIQAKLEETTHKMTSEEKLPNQEENLLPRIVEDARVYDEDGKLVAVYLAALLSGPLAAVREFALESGVLEAVDWTDVILLKFLSAISKYPPKFPGRTDKRYGSSLNAEISRWRELNPGKFMGDFHFVSWAAQGQNISKEQSSANCAATSVSAGSIKREEKRAKNRIVLEGEGERIGLRLAGKDEVSGTDADSFFCLMKLLKPLFILLSDVLLAIAPEVYALYKEAYNRGKDNLFKMCMPPENVFLGLVIVDNMTVVPHRDEQDFRGGFTAMTTLGNYRGGDLVLSNLKVDGKSLRFRYQPGDVVFFRAATVIHYILPWEGTDRHSFILFSHAKSFYS